MVEDVPAAIEHGCEDMSWELFEEWFQEMYLSEEFIECHPNELNSLRQGSHMMIESEAVLWSFFGMLPT
jgi:hypothetical protein